MHAIQYHHLLTKGAVSSCRLIFLSQDRHCFHLSICNKSQYLTSTYSSPQSKHFKKKCQPKYSNFEKRKQLDRLSNSDCLIFLPFHHICYLYSQKQFKYLDIFNAKTFEKLQTISCFPFFIYAYSYKLHTRRTRRGK